MSHFNVLFNTSNLITYYAWAACLFLMFVCSMMYKKFCKLKYLKKLLSKPYYISWDIDLWLVKLCIISSRYLIHFGN